MATTRRKFLLGSSGLVGAAGAGVGVAFAVNPEACADLHARLTAALEEVAVAAGTVAVQVLIASAATCPACGQILFHKPA